MENHKSLRSIQNSLIIKRFLFEQIFVLTSLSYIAFALLDITILKNEMTMLFIIDSIRRIMLETVLPMVNQTIYKIR